jgi:hypothetical protein
VKDPPNPPDPPDCTTYPNYCAFVPPQLEAQQVPGQYSMTLNNLSKAQLDHILEQLGIDQKKLTPKQ